MECNHCKNTIQTAVKKLPGLENIAIDLNSREVEITGEISPDVIIKTIKEAGYTAEIK
jgi:copper chaperone CopZ